MVTTHTTLHGSPCGQGVSQSAAQRGDDETAEHVRVQLPVAHPPGFLWRKIEHAYASWCFSCSADLWFWLDTCSCHNTAALGPARDVQAQKAGTLGAARAQGPYEQR